MPRLSSGFSRRMTTFIRWFALPSIIVSMVNTGSFTRLKLVAEDLGSPDTACCEQWLWPEYGEEPR